MVRQGTEQRTHKRTCQSAHHGNVCEGANGGQRGAQLRAAGGAAIVHLQQRSKPGGRRGRSH